METYLLLLCVFTQSTEKNGMKKKKAFVSDDKKLSSSTHAKNHSHKKLTNECHVLDCTNLLDPFTIFVLNQRVPWLLLVWSTSLIKDTTLKEGLVNVTLVEGTSKEETDTKGKDHINEVLIDWSTDLEIGGLFIGEDVVSLLPLPVLLLNLFQMDHLLVTVGNRVSGEGQQAEHTERLWWFHGNGAVLGSDKVLIDHGFW